MMPAGWSSRNVLAGVARLHERLHGRQGRLEGALQKYRSRIDSLKRSLATGVPPSRVQDEPSSPRDRIYLERGLSALKHGIVEACFYNLRALAQKIVSDGPSEEAWRRLRRASRVLPAVQHEVDGFLADQTPDGRRVGGLIPEMERAFQQLLGQLQEVCEDAGWEGLDQVPVLIDEALESLRQAAERIRRQRLSVRVLVQQALELERSRLETAGLDVTLRCEVVDGTVHATEGELLASLVELLRNATLHRRDAVGGYLRIYLHEDSQTVNVELRNGPAAFPPAPQGHLARPGVSRRRGGGDGLARVQELVRRLGGSMVVGYEHEPREFLVRLSLPSRLPI